MVVNSDNWSLEKIQINNESSAKTGDPASNKAWIQIVSGVMTVEIDTGAITTLVSRTASETLTNKTIDADSNTITNIGSSEIKAEIITGLSADATPDGATDYVMTYDASATALKKVLLDDLPGGAGGGASTALDNLASVAINTTLVSDTDSTDDLGTSSVYWRSGYIDTLYLTEQSAPSTPATDHAVVYPKTDGKLYFKNDAGTEYDLTSTGGAGGDTDAIHDNVAGEIAAISAKSAPTTSDLLLIEDVADSNNKKKITIGALPGTLPYIHIQTQATAGTAGGAASATTWHTRVLTEVTDTDNHCAISSNQITLTAGTYEIEIVSYVYRVAENKLRLRNVTDTSTVLAGASAYAGSAATDGGSPTTLSGRFTIAASKALEVQHYCTGAKTTNGLGVPTNAGETEVYCDIRLHKVA